MCFQCLVENGSHHTFSCMLVMLQPGSHPTIVLKLPQVSLLVCPASFLLDLCTVHHFIPEISCKPRHCYLLRLLPIAWLPGLLCGILLFFPALKCSCPQCSSSFFLSSFISLSQSFISLSQMSQTQQDGNKIHYLPPHFGPW